VHTINTRLYFSPGVILAKNQPGDEAKLHDYKLMGGASNNASGTTIPHFVKILQKMVQITGLSFNEIARFGCLNFELSHIPRCN